MFGLAAIDYGRVDYGVLDGAPQAWEINTNPTIGRGPGPRVPYRPEVAAYKEMLAPAFGAFYEKFEDAWRAVDTADAAGGVEFDVPRGLRRTIEAEAKRRRQAELVGAFVGVIARQAWVRPMTRLLKRGLASVASTRLRLGR